MSFNKKCISMMLLVMVFGQMGAMKRKAERGLYGSIQPNKRVRQSDIVVVDPKHVEPIGYSFPSVGKDLPAQGQFAFSMEESKISESQKSQKPVFTVLPEEKKSNSVSMKNIDLMPSEKELNQFQKFSDKHHKQKLSRSIRKGDVTKTSEYLAKVPTITSLTVNEILATDVFAQQDKITLSKELREKYKVDLNRPDSKGKAPVHIAAENNEELVLMHLLDEGSANPNAKVAKTGWTPAHFATKPDVLEVLRRAGGKLDAQDNEGNTPSHLSPGNKSLETELQAYFSSRNALPNVKNKLGLNQYEHGLYNFGVVSSHIKDHDAMAKTTKTAISRTMGKPLHQFIFDRADGTDKRSFLNTPFKYNISWDDSSNSGSSFEED